jgi:deoxycytidine triphosphate deaminase
LFFRSDKPCEIGYAGRRDKYQEQQGIVLPKH